MKTSILQKNIGIIRRGTFIKLGIDIYKVLYIGFYHDKKYKNKRSFPDDLNDSFYNIWEKFKAKEHILKIHCNHNEKGVEPLMFLELQSKYKQQCLFRTHTGFAGLEIL